MAIDVRVRSRTPLMVSGHDVNGAVVNNKTMVQGDLDITTYTTSGEPIVPKDFGLTVIDALFIDILDVDGGVSSTSSILIGNYDRTNELLLLWDGNGGVTVAGSNAQVRFLAFGDSAAAPDLT